VLRITAFISSKNLHFDGFACECRLEDDGTLLFLFSGKYEGEPSEVLEVELSFIFSMPEHNEAFQTTETLSFTLLRTGYFAEAASRDAIEFTDAGVRVDKVVLTAGEMSVNVRIEYTVIDTEKFAATDSGLWFGLPADDGERYPAIGESSVRPLDNEATQLTQAEGTRFVHYCSISTMESLPDDITIRGFNLMNKTEYDTHTFKL